MIDLERHFSPAVAARLERLIKFALTGGVGFVVDVGLLTLQTVVFDVNPYLARVFAILIAMTVTWMINRRFTFKTHGKVTEPLAMAAEGGRYGLVAVTAALVNYGVYAATLYVMPAVIVAGENLSPPIAAVVGSCVAMFVSYFGYSRFAFRHAEPQPVSGG